MTGYSAAYVCAPLSDSAGSVCLDAKAQTIQEKRSLRDYRRTEIRRRFPVILITSIQGAEGGTLTLAAIGTFDNFNRYALRSDPQVRTEALYDTLFTTSDDEPGSYCPLIAERARYAEDYSWMEIALNPRARFHDGTPITARDVAFTFNKFMTEGVPQFRLFYKGTSVKAIAPLTVRIDLGQPGKGEHAESAEPACDARAFWRQHKLKRPAVGAAAGQRAIPHQRLANGAIHYLFPGRQLLGGRPAGQPRSLEFRYAAL